MSTEGHGGTFLRVLGLLVALALVISLPLAFLARSVAGLLRSPETLTELAQENMVDSGALHLFLFNQMAEMAPTGVEGISLDAALAELDRAERLELAALVLPRPWLEDLVAGFVQAFYLWLEGDQPVPQVTVDLEPVRGSVLGNADEIAEKVVVSWPPCTPREAQQWQAAFLGTAPPPETLCQPPEPARGFLIRAVSTGLEGMAEEIPPEMSLGPAFAEQADLGRLARARRILALGRDLALFAWLVPLGLLGLLVLLVVRSWPALGRWWGVPLFFGGLLTFAPVGLFLLLGPDLTRGVAGPGTSPSLALALRGFLDGVIRAVLSPLLWQSAALTLGGLAMATLGWVFADRSG